MFDMQTLDTVTAVINHGVNDLGWLAIAIRWLWLEFDRRKQTRKA